MKAVSDGIFHTVVLTTFSLVSKQSEGGEHPTRDPLVSLERQRASPVWRRFRQDLCKSKYFHNLAVHALSTVDYLLSANHISWTLLLSFRLFYLGAFNLVWQKKQVLAWVRMETVESSVVKCLQSTDAHFSLIAAIETISKSLSINSITSEVM